MDIQDALPTGWFIGRVSKSPNDGIGYAINGSSEYLFCTSGGHGLTLEPDGKFAFTDHVVMKVPEPQTEIICEPDLTTPDAQVVRWGLLEDAERLLARTAKTT